ncbi:MAG: hypothetical protein K2X86_00005 [Cytophagaceae bacterium]|nr:hypothetical protein [Cytophagaceae bacterium]
MKPALRYFFLFIIFYISLSAVSAQKNKGTSNSIGEHHKDALKNAYRLTRKGSNFKYFSRFSYCILGSAHLHSKAYKTILDSYQELEEKYPDRKFRVMECSKKKGGKMLLHRNASERTQYRFHDPSY